MSVYLEHHQAAVNILVAHVERELAEFSCYVKCESIYLSITCRRAAKEEDLTPIRERIEKLFPTLQHFTNNPSPDGWVIMYNKAATVMGIQLRLGRRRDERQAKVYRLWGEAKEFCHGIFRAEVVPDILKLLKEKLKATDICEVPASIENGETTPLKIEFNHESKHYCLRNGEMLVYQLDKDENIMQLEVITQEAYNDFLNFHQQEHDMRFKADLTLNIFD